MASFLGIVAAPSSIGGLHGQAERACAKAAPIAVAESA